MALNPESLTDGFTALFEGRDGYPATTGAAAAAWAALYRGYASAARAATTAPSPAALATAEENLVGTLDRAFARARDTGASGLAGDLDKAFVEFWLEPPVTLADDPPTVNGVVTAAPPGVLGPALAAVFATGIAQRRSAAAQAGALAAALDAWTRTVVVVNTPPGPSAPVVLT
jgi:hypothetical protein